MTRFQNPTRITVALLCSFTAGCCAACGDSPTPRMAPEPRRQAALSPKSLYKQCLARNFKSCFLLSRSTREWHALTIAQRINVGRIMYEVNKRARAFYGRLLSDAWKREQARQLCGGTCLQRLVEGCHCEGLIAMRDLDFRGALRFFEIGCTQRCNNSCLGVGNAKVAMGDLEGAASTFRRLCRSGNKYACVALGGMRNRIREFG